MKKSSGYENSHNVSTRFLGIIWKCSKKLYSLIGLTHWLGRLINELLIKVWNYLNAFTKCKFMK